MPRTARLPLGTFALVALLALVHPVSAGAQATDIRGHWSGEVRIPGNVIEFNVDFRRADGAWAGDVSIPLQGIQDVALTGVSLEGRTVTFGIPDIPGTPVFTGELSEDGQEIKGTLAQAGNEAPFTLTFGEDVHALTRDAMDGFREWLEARLEEWVVPGMGIGVVWDGEVVYSEGFGLRDVDEALPVTPNTLFAIGSSSKAFTAFGVGLLVDDGEVDFDQPVAELLPGLRLHDATATALLTPRDMLTHRSGLPRHDMAWYNQPLMTPDSLFKVLRYFEPNRDIRETWQYNNMMFATSGHLIEQLSGESWEDFTKARILDPLGMSDTNFEVAVSQAAADHAKPYREEDDRLDKIPFRDITNIGPAGSINSNVTDMVKWVEMQLGGGSFEGQEVIQSATLDQMHTPHMVISAKPTEPMLGPRSYGLGWFTDSYRGHFRVHHGGNIDGFSALVTLYPHESLGIVALSNKNGTPLPELASRQIADRLLRMEPRDWSGEARERIAAAEEAQEEGGDDSEEDEERVEGTAPSYPLDDYVGEYEHLGYGLAHISKEGDDLHFHYNGMSAPLEHWHFDVFEAGENPDDATLEGRRVQFRLDLDGRIEALRIDLEPAVDPIVFSRAADDALEDPDYLAGLVGRYQFTDGNLAEVTLSGTTLTVTVANQPPYRLEPQQEDTFGLAGLEGYRLRFEVEDGVATEIVFLQPNGTFRATRLED